VGSEDPVELYCSLPLKLGHGYAAYMGGIEARTPVLVEPLMRHHISMTVFLTRKRTPVDGQFGWGGTRLKRYQARPKVGSGGTEIHRRV
jgi:hypothetical protein